jgi:cytochrome P450
MITQQEQAQRFLAATALSGVEPLFEDVAFGHPYPMGIEEPNYHERLREIRENVGVAPGWFIKGLGKAWVITRYEDVKAAFLDTETFQPQATQEITTFPFTGEQMLGFSGRKHTDFRRVVFPAFKKTTVPDYEETLLRPQAESLVDEMFDDGEADLMETFAKRYPLAIIKDIMGLPVENWDEVAGWARDIILGGEYEVRAAGANAFRAYALPLLEERRRSPGDDVLSRLLSGRVDGRALTDEEVISFMLLLFPAGVDTTWLTLGSLMAAILSKPGTVDRLRHSAEDLVWAIEETLRWEPPTPGIPRVTVRDTEVSGVKIPAGSMCVLNLAAANREPGRFGDTDPDLWHLDRRPVGHIAFGVGEHFCLGVHLARAELRIALEVLLERLPSPRLLEEPVFVGAAIRGPRSLRIGWG